MTLIGDHIDSISLDDNDKNDEVIFKDEYQDQYQHYKTLKVKRVFKRKLKEPASQNPNIKFRKFIRTTNAPAFNSQNNLPFLRSVYEQNDHELKEAMKYQNQLRQSMDTANRNRILPKKITRKPY